MKFPMKKLVVALALAAAAGQAGAAVVPASTGDGDLFLTAWDSVLNVSYSRDLGVDMNSFLPNSLGGTATTAGLTDTFAGDALFASTFSGSSASNILWNVVAGDNILTSGQQSYTPGALRILTTSTATSGTGITFTEGGLGTGTGNINYFQGYQVNLGCGTAPSCSTSNPADPGFGGNGDWGSSFGGIGAAHNTGTGFGSSLDFFYITGSGSSLSINPATKDIYAGTAGNATWTLASNGTLTYAVPNVSAVPIPAAAWLFGSGLLGLVGIARRKQQG